ncbi:MAG: anaerobic carbon-monoxide dehydrogenase catalytic subunit [Euryarchaeota archaeon]|nr:anaerobic carbon-monoxide dehydrogenase catalytic subunit [Euryarchaeota archaeon]MBU4139590.1 anaerobic carbon-monoxide dehydrogenase catalytic subunit [Euryarchaeota archaeon]
MIPSEQYKKIFGDQKQILITQGPTSGSDRRALDDPTEEMINYTERMGIDTIFSKLTKSCKSGSLGICCKQCALGPCRSKGACGANVDTIVARNLLMMVGRGMACHASHSLHAASVLQKTARYETDYTIKDPEKLKSIALKLKLDTSQGTESMALQVASQALSDIAGNKTSMSFVSYLPSSVVNPLLGLGVIPGSVGKELLDENHETSMGVMADPTSLILHAARLGIADIVSMIIGSELQDVLLGTPELVQSKIGFSVLEKNMVNLVVHGHDPLLAEKIIELSEDEGLRNRAIALGASGINIVGCCCTGNELIMRHGIPLAGSNLQQELIIATGLVEAFVVDVQCIYPNIVNVAGNFHTKIITTMKEGKISGAEHIPFDEEHSDRAARRILEVALENFKKRGNTIYLPKGEPKELIAGFSVETCLKMLANINPEDPLKPLIDNIVSGNINGIVLLAGCTSPRVVADASHVTIAKNLMEQNVLVVATGCAAQACARAGLLSPDASQYAGDGLKDVLALLGEKAGLGRPLPPVWHFGSCVDNGRVIILISAIAEKLGVPIMDLPIAASAAEWVAEKATSIGTGALTLGITVHLGIIPPVLGSPEVTALLTQGSEDLFGGKFIVEVDPERASQLILEHIAEARRKLGLEIFTAENKLEIQRSMVIGPNLSLIYEKGKEIDVETTWIGVHG